MLRLNRKRDRFTYMVTWSQENNKNIGFCREFPSLRSYASRSVDALKEIQEQVWRRVREMEDAGEEPPVAMAI